VKKLIDDKAKGQKRQAPPPKPVRSNVNDIVAALQESLAQPGNAEQPDAY
jgi:non-homologous end joining protein Ku